MATFYATVKTRLLSVLVCCALLIGAFAAVELAATPALAASAHPSISVSPNPVTSSTCSNVTVSGKHFVGGGNIVIVYVDGQFTGGEDVAPDGTFTHLINACSLAPGKHTVTADSSDGSSARTVLRVR